MIGTIAIVVLVLVVVAGGILIYRKHRATIDREAARIAAQAKEAADKVKDKVKK